jgi:tetratricopeptide (TPR) repeat protein
MSNQPPPTPTRPIERTDLTLTLGTPPPTIPATIPTPPIPNTLLPGMLADLERQRDAACAEAEQERRNGRRLYTVAFLLMLLIVVTALVLWLRQEDMERRLRQTMQANQRVEAEPQAAPAGKPREAGLPDGLAGIDPARIANVQAEIGRAQQQFNAGLGDLHNMIQDGRQRLVKAQQDQQMLARRLQPGGGARKPAVAAPEAEGGRPPSDADDFLHRGMARRRQGRLVEAEDDLREAIRQKPELAEAHAELGRVHHTAGDLRKAIDCYAEAMKLDPKVPGVQEDLNRAVKGQGFR